MYVIKNAFKSIGRSKGRNILIGIIVFVIAVSACIGLSIRQAAESAKSETLDLMSITGAISFDRQSLMEGMRSRGSFDTSQFASLMGSASSLTLEEYEKYADAESVKDFYYSSSMSVNGSEAFEPVSTSDSSADDDSTGGMMGGMMGGMSSMMGVQGDFRITGYSAETAMTSFLDGTSYISDGVVFEEGTSALDCIINSELAIYNDLSVGDTIIIENPNSEDETYELTIVGTYITTATNEQTSMMSTISSDPANQIYMSYNALLTITNASESAAVIQTDEDTGLETSTAMTNAVTGIYVFTDTDAYARFEEEVRAMGLSDSYTISSPDISAYENSLAPLNTLSTMAGYFLVVVLLIGAIILIVLNIFNVRERKYEVGVLTAIGMKKGKVAIQFLSEIFIVTIIAVVIGAGIGAVSSVPVTNALLESQVTSQQASQEQTETNFGRGGMMGGGGMGNFSTVTTSTDYVSEVSSATNMTVLLQLLGIGILLTLIAGAVSILFVMRYEPLKILANRD